MSDTSTSSPEPAHRQVQSAHDRYFQEISQAWADTQSKFQAAQIDYERSLAKACQAQQTTDFQAMQDDYQRTMQALCTDASPAQRYAEAYRNYKTAMQTAIATADVDELHVTDLARLSQSLYAVSQMAMCLMPCDPAATGNPFEAEKPPPAQS